MKDPLQIKDTPYEILGISIDADKKAIENAFKISIAKGGDASKKTEARNTLNRPIERAFVDIFLYNEGFINHLIPGINGNNIVLIDKRKEVAQEWSDMMIKSFPKFAYIHSLAVLWYWWAIYCEEEQWALHAGAPFEKKENLSPVYTLSNLWSNAISNWVCLLNSEDFWREWIESTGKNRIYLYNNDDIKAFCQKLESHFINLFHNLCERYRNVNDSASAERYEEYELLFSTEMKTAKQLSDAGFHVMDEGRKIRICCGSTMLEKVGSLDETKDLIRNTEGKNLENDKMINELAIGLSSFGNISVLIENKKFDEAIKVIKSLPSDQQKEKDVLKLLANAYLEKGKQHFSLNQFRDAMECWKNGLDTGEYQDDIKQAIIYNCKTKAASLQKSDSETSIRVLKLGLEIVHDNTLTEILSVIYCDRGISRIINAQKQKTDMNSAKKDIEIGVMNLKKAVEFNASNTRARDQLKIAEDINDNFDLIDIYEYINTNQWEKAVVELENILKNEPENSKAKELHSICCNSWGSEEFGRTHDLEKTKEILLRGLKYNPHSKELNEAIDALTKLYAGKSNTEGVELANRATELYKIGNFGIAIGLLREAEKKIEDAVKKDPSNSTYKSNLAQIRDMLGSLRSQLGYSNNYSMTSTFDRMKEWESNNRIWFWLAVISMILFILGLSK